MTGFLNKALIVAGALGFVFSVSAAAETGLPRPLAPETASPPAGPSADPPAPAPAGRTIEPAAGDRGGAAIEIEDLSEPDPQSVGTLTSTQAGFGPATWSSLSAAFVAERLPALPAFERSAVMRDLTRRMLLSQSQGPRVEPAGAWLIERVRALNAMGLWRDAAGLAERAPQSDWGIARLAVEARLMLGEEASACLTVRAAAEAPAGGFWGMARAFCQVLSGEAASAQLSLDALREAGIADEAFFAAAAMALDGRKPVATPELSQPLQMAMWRHAKLPPPPALLQREDAAAAALIGAMAGQDPTLRLAASGGLARLGLMPAAEWLAVMGLESVKADQKDDPEEAAKSVPIATGDALFLRALRSRTVPAARASAFAALLGRCQDRGEFPYAAALLAGDARQIDPLPETAWAAPVIARVLVYNGDVARALQWFRALNPASPSDQPVIHAVAVYAWVKDPAPERAEPLQKALQWLAAAAAKPGPNRQSALARLSREGPILAALGVVLPPDALGAAESDSPGLALDQDGPELFRVLDEAATTGSKGSAVLAASLLLKGQGAAAARSQTVARIVRGLGKVGLRKEARALALEALLGGGKAL
jgi:hypothetical protein